MNFNKALYHVSNILKKNVYFFSLLILIPFNKYKVKIKLIYAIVLTSILMLFHLN